MDLEFHPRLYGSGDNALSLSPYYTVRGWAAGTIEIYTKEVNEIIKVIG